jgi:hypothetical protein
MKDYIFWCMSVFSQLLPRRRFGIRASCKQTLHLYCMVINQECWPLSLRMSIVAGVSLGCWSYLLLQMTWRHVLEDSIFILVIQRQVVHVEQCPYPVYVGRLFDGLNVMFGLEFMGPFHFKTLVPYLSPSLLVNIINCMYESSICVGGFILFYARNGAVLPSTDESSPPSASSVVDFRTCLTESTDI